MKDEDWQDESWSDKSWKDKRVALEQFDLETWIRQDKNLKSRVIQSLQKQYKEGEIDEDVLREMEDATDEQVAELFVELLKTTGEGKKAKAFADTLVTSLAGTAKLFEERNKLNDQIEHLRTLLPKRQGAALEKGVTELHQLHEKFARSLLDWFRHKDPRLKELSDDEVVSRWASLQMLHDIDNWMMNQPEAEEDLIEDLNEAEYKLTELSSGPFTANKATRKQDKIVRQLREELSRRHDGIADRFGLRGKSKVELQHLLQETEHDIQELEAQIERSRGVWSTVGTNVNQRARDFLKGFEQLFPKLRPTPHKYQLFLKRQLLSDLKLRLKMPLQELSAAEEEARRVSEDVEEMNLTITLLEKKCEEAAKQHPVQANAIRRRYRKAIDTILERS